MPRQNGYQGNHPGSQRHISFRIKVEYVDDRAKDENIRLRGPDHKIRAENNDRYPDFEGFEDPNPPNRALMALELLSKREKQANAKLVPIKKGT